MWGEFLVISEHLGTRDFSRERCSESDMHLLARLSAWLTELEPGLSQQFSDITTQLVAPDWQRPLSSWKVTLKGRVRCFRSLSATLDDLARAGFPAHMGRASSWPNALADRDLLSWLCLQTRFRQILEGARIVDRLVAKLLQRFSGKRRAPT